MCHRVSEAAKTHFGVDITGAKGGVAFLLKHSLVINKECRDRDFNIITDSKALMIRTDLSNSFWLAFAA